MRASWTLIALTTLAHGCALVAGLDEFCPRAGGGSTSTSGGGGSVGGAGGDGAGSSSSTGGSPCAVDVFITEVRTSGPDGATDELVEIFNPTNAAIDLSTIRIVGKPLAGTNFNDKWPGAATFIEPMQWLVFGGPNYSGPPLPEEFVLNQSFGNDQVIALVRVEGANTVELDQVILCCDNCMEFPVATPNPACDVNPVDPATSLHREPACVDGALVAGPPTPFEAAP